MRLFTKFGNPAPLSQQVVRHAGGDLFLSYGTPIAKRFDDGRVHLYPDWDYSTTTGEYRNQFLGEKKWQTQQKIKRGEYTLKDKAPRA